MQNKTYCNFPDSGLFISHRKSSLCCVAKKTQKMSPLEFWNSEYRKDSLLKMKKGEQVSECIKCYDDENKGIVSHRSTYTNQSFPVKSCPSRLDLDLSNFCNLRCIMCNPERSSEWAKELNVYTETKGINRINPTQLDYIKQLTTADLQAITIQGGEPSIMPEFDEYFQFLKEKDYMKNISIQVITNLTNINRKFFEYLNEFKSVNLDVSVDGFGLANNYIRFPSNFDQIEKNLIEISKRKSNIRTTILTSLQILSLYNFDDMLNWYNKMQQIYQQNNKTLHIVPMTVQFPAVYNVFNAPAKLKEKFANAVNKFNNISENKTTLKSHLQLLVKRQRHTECDLNLIDQLKLEIEKLDSRRNIKITDYIPNFYQLI